MTLPAPPDGYRPCAGAVVFNDDGLVFVGRRSDLGPEVEHAWQLPQGGIDDGEHAEVGARRELYEETGIRSVTLLGGHDTWLTYDFPAEMQGKRFKRYQGQAQAWFAYAFNGDVAEIDLSHHGKPEFQQWDWVPLKTVPTLIVPFKRTVYDAIVAAFEPYAAMMSEKGQSGL